MSFAPRPTVRVGNSAERMAAYLDMPFSLGQNLSEQFQQGILDSYGLGTIVRETVAPGNLGERLNNNTGMQPLADPFGILDSGKPSLTEEQYRSSPWFREAVPFDAGMTEDRAKALAGFYDLKQVRAHFAEKRPLSSFFGQLAGQAFDPINYVPVFGPAARVAAIARAGSIGGRVMLSASEAAINTAAFGVLTSNIRRQFGDDVSWQAIISEVATSAIIGGAFGGVAGVFARRGDARARLEANQVQERLSTVRTAQEARIPLNEAIDGLVTNGEVRLSPNGMGAIERIENEVISRTEGRRTLDAETRDVGGTRPGEVAITPDGTRVAVRPEVVELSSLQRATGAYQVRGRVNSAVSDAQIEDIAINLDPARLMPSVSADQGAPIVGADNMIDSGNGRVAAIGRAYEAYPEKAKAYRAALEAAGYPTEGMQAPVLISRRVTDLSPPARAEFNAKANASSTARMNAAEIAAMDRAALSDDVLSVLGDGPVTAADNRAFVDRFLGNLPQNERGALVTEGGTALNADGVRRIENALIAEAYGDVDPAVIRRFAEATDDNTRSIVGAMSDVAGRWAQMRRAIKAGEIAPEYDMTTELTDALRLIGGWRSQSVAEKRAISTVIREGMAQMDLLSGEVSPEAQVFIRMFYANDHFAQAVGRDKLAARFGKVIESTYELGRPSLFGDAMPVTKQEVLRNATNDEQTDLFAPDSPRERTGEIGQGRVGDQAGADRSGDQAGGERSDEPRLDDLLIRRADASSPPPEPPVEGLDLAAARVGKGETMKEAADDRGVNLATGEFAEQFDIDQMRDAGLLSKEDEANLKAAEEDYAAAEHYGNAMKAAASCFTRG